MVMDEQLEKQHLLSDEHYLNHLTEVNKHNKVVLSEDIYNQNGVLVIKKGVEVDSELTYKIARHKLKVPIDQSISLNQAITYEHVIESFQQRLQELKLGDLFQKTAMFDDALRAFKVIPKHPQVAQKLTILKERLPDIFSRSLTRSGMAINVCKELNLSENMSENIFLATLISDVGLLHIAPEIVNKDKEFTPQEWKMMQGHVAIGKHFTDQIKAIPPEVGKALLEHHERLDGYGYPFGKTAESLSVEGQVIAIVDKMSGVVKKLVSNGTYSWQSVIHVMQISSTAHSAEVHDALLRVLKRVQFPFKPAFELNAYKSLVDQCILKRRRLDLWLKEFSKIYADHKQFMNDSPTFKPIGLLHKLEYTVANTGLFDHSLDDWLDSLRLSISDSDYSDIEEFALLLDEIEYRCLFVMRKFEEAKDELAQRFGGVEIVLAYHQGLRSILAR